MEPDDLTCACRANIVPPMYECLPVLSCTPILFGQPVASLLASRLANATECDNMGADLEYEGICIFIIHPAE